MKQPLKYQFWHLSISISVALVSITFITQIKTQVLASSSILLSRDTGNSSTTVISALDIFRKAYENRYTWNPQFPGYTAIIELKHGNKHYRGNVIVKSDMSVQVTGIDEEEARQMVEISLKTMLTHHRRVPFSEEHKDSTFKLVGTDKTGVAEIIEQGQKTEARYKIFHNQLTQVNRILGNTAVTVDVIDSEKTSEGYLATRYRSTFRQPQTKQIIGVEESKDAYIKTAGYYVLTHQIIHDYQEGQLTDTAEFRYINIELSPNIH
jgi:hypothetical protein